MNNKKMIEHCKTSIKVCEEKILIEGENGKHFWEKLKLEWEKKLKELKGN